MKIRQGFVSNSSSSSFICNVCDTVESGMDACPVDFEMIECEKDHTICESHIIGERKLVGQEGVDEDDLDEFILKSECCPLCTKDFIPDKDVVAYLVKKKNLNLEEIKKEMKNEN